MNRLLKQDDFVGVDQIFTAVGEIKRTVESRFDNIEKILADLKKVYEIPPLPNEQVEKPFDYTEWLESVTGVKVPPPNYFPNTSFTNETSYGEAINLAMVDVETTYAESLLAELQRNNVPGAIVEFGIYQGFWLDKLDNSCKKLSFSKEIYGFDSFEGLSKPDQANDLDGWKEGDYSASYNFVSNKLNIKERRNIHLIQGWFKDSLPRHEAQSISQICYARIDSDLYEPAQQCLEYLGSRLVDGSILVFDDWTFAAFRGETKAFAEWLPTVPHLKFEFLCFNGIGHFYFRVHHRK